MHRAYPDASIGPVELSYPQEDQHLCLTWRHLQRTTLRPHNMFLLSAMDLTVMPSVTGAPPTCRHNSLLNKN